ncbi:MAG: hypothetical protein AAF380_01980 [Bacteroidota bacterium]
MDLLVQQGKIKDFVDNLDPQKCINFHKRKNDKFTLSPVFINYHTCLTLPQKCDMLDYFISKGNLNIKKALKVSEKEALWITAYINACGPLGEKIIQRYVSHLSGEKALEANFELSSEDQKNIENLLKTLLEKTNITIALLKKASIGYTVEAKDAKEKPLVIKYLKYASRKEAEDIVEAEFAHIKAIQQKDSECNEAVLAQVEAMKNDIITQEIDLVQERQNTQYGQEMYQSNLVKTIQIAEADDKLTKAQKEKYYIMRKIPGKPLNQVIKDIQTGNFLKDATEEQKLEKFQQLEKGIREMITLVMYHLCFVEPNFDPDIHLGNIIICFTEDGKLII